MKTISITNDIIPIAEFKTGISKWFKCLQKSGHPLIITQNGKPAGVLISPSEFDELRQTKLFIDSISRGLSDSDQGVVLSTSQIRNELKKSRAGRQK